MGKADAYGRKGSMHAGQVNSFAYLNIYIAIKVHRVIKIVLPNWLCISKINTQICYSALNFVLKKLIKNFMCNDFGKITPLSETFIFYLT